MARHTDISDDGLIDLADLTSLKRLRATGSRITRAGLDERKRTIPDLKVEWFPETNRDLRVRLKPRNYLDPPSGDDAIHLSERTLIKEVRQLTKEHQGGNRNPNAIVFAANINQDNGFVRTFDLSGSKVTADQIHRARWCRNLTHFRLWQTQVGDDAFAYVHRNRFLERVFIWDKTVSDESMKHLSRLPNLFYLEM